MEDTEIMLEMRVSFAWWLNPCLWLVRMGIIMGLPIGDKLIDRIAIRAIQMKVKP